jgi:UDP-glucose:(heptosyl)LPS alpha-1,3-glucosyltransferase
MKIAFAIEHFSPDQGGAEQYAWGFARWLVDAGHELDVYTLRAPRHATFVSGLHLLDVPASRGPARHDKMARALKAALARRRHDIVQGFNHVRPCDVLRLGGGVHLAFEHYNALSASTALARSMHAWSYKMLPRYRAVRHNEALQFSDSRRRFIAVSNRVAGDMARYYPDCADRITVVHNGVDLEWFNPDEVAHRRAAARQQFGILEKEIVLLFVSNNYRLKGLYDLVRALPLVKQGVEGPVKLLVVGRGRRTPFQRLASSLKVAGNIVFAGALDDLRDAYAAADVLVHPSYYDAFGFVGLEAMACGLPVLISRNSGVSEVTDERGAVLVDMPCSTEALADAVRRASDSVFRRAARPVNWQRANEYPIESNYRRVLDLYEQVVDGR